jgi:hypothetical protein
VLKVIRDGKVEHIKRPETDESSLEFDSYAYSLNMIKPVLKRSLYHLGQPVIVVFKSFEVWMVEHKNQKVHNPIYVPLEQADLLAQLPVTQIE